MSDGALAWRQFRLERKQFWRNPSAAFFNFLMPPLLLVLVASAFAPDDAQLEILVPGVAGVGVLASTFTALAFRLPYLREEGILKRLRGTPIPASIFLGAWIASSIVNACAQVAVIVVIGNLAYDVPLPQEPLTLAAFTVLGVVCFAALGVAFAHAIPNWDSAPAYVNAVFMPLIFISGAFYSAEELPAALEAIAEALPLKHVIDGLAAGVVGGGGELGTAAAVVAAWAVAGLVLAVRGFRWEPQT